MVTFIVVLVLMLTGCGGVTETPVAGDGGTSPLQPSSPATSEPATRDAGSVEEVILSSCGTGIPTQERPYVTCVEWYGFPGSDPACKTNPLRPVETDPDSFGLHAFQGPCPTAFYVGKCEHRFVWEGKLFRTIEVFVPNVMPWRPEDWYLRRDEFKTSCEESGGGFIPPTPNVPPTYPCKPGTGTCPPDGGSP